MKFRAQVLSDARKTLATPPCVCMAIFAAHLLVSHFILPALGKADLYPFYSWNLFSFTPDRLKFYFMKILSVDGVDLNPPQLVHQQRVHYQGSFPRLVPHQIERLGRALDQHRNETQIHLLKSELERNLFLNFKDVRYEIVASEGSIRKLLKADEVPDFETLGKFEYTHQGTNNGER